MSKLDERNLEWYLEREEERKKDIISSMLDSADDLASSIANKVLKVASTFQKYPAIRNVTVSGPPLNGSLVGGRDLYVLVTVDKAIFGMRMRKSLQEDLSELEGVREGERKNYLKVPHELRFNPRLKLTFCQSKEKLIKDARSYRQGDYLYKSLGNLGPLMIASGVNLGDKDKISITVLKELARRFDSFSDFKLEIRNFEELLRERELKGTTFYQPVFELRAAYTP